MKTDCSCGKNETHIIMSRNTSDGKTVCLWSDGYITDRTGEFYGHVRKICSLEVACVAMGEVGLETQHTVNELISAAARVARSKVREPGKIRDAISRIRQTTETAGGVE